MAQMDQVQGNGAKVIGWVEDSIYQTPDEVLQGALAFVHEHSGWSIRLGASWGNIWESMPLAGLIGGINSPIHQYATQRRLPYVTLSHNHTSLPAASVLMNLAHVATTALSHLSERGLSQIHYFRTYNRNEGIRPWQLEKELLAAAPQYNMLVSVVPEGQRVTASGWSLAKQLTDLQDYLAAAVRPAAILAADLEHGQRALTAVEQAGYLIPDDLSIVVVTGSNIRCELSNPPLTNVMPDRFAIGYAAAKMVYDIHHGLVPANHVVHIPPRGIVARQSSDFLSVEDPLVRQALRWIDENVQHCIDVADVVDAMSVSRTTLHRRFVSAIGNGPQQMIRRAMVRRAVELLTTSDLPVNEVAVRSGFAHPTQLSRDMKKLTGQNPTDIRRKQTSL